MVALALIPAIVLLVYIYKKDKKEKEPMKLLLKCFFWGVLSTIAVLVLEELGSSIFEDDLIQGSIKYAAVDGFVIAALSEEFCKFVTLKRCTWKSPEFNCRFDGIVYAVFVSLGFAACENVFYVIDGGLSIAILRMFTAVPLHALCAVYMGFYYSKAKEASIYADRRSERRNKRRALFIPILVHGFYDFLLSIDADVEGESAFLVSFLIWIAFVIVMFIISLKLVKKASLADDFFKTDLGTDLNQTGTDLNQTGTDLNQTGTDLK